MNRRQHTTALATQAAEKDLKDYRGQLWLGEICWAEGERGQAEEAFRRSLKLNPAAPETWKALILCLVDAGAQGGGGSGTGEGPDFRAAGPGGGRVGRRGTRRWASATRRKSNTSPC